MFRETVGHTSAMFLGRRRPKMEGRSAHHRRDRLPPPWREVVLP